MCFFIGVIVGMILSLPVFGEYSAPARSFRIGYIIGGTTIGLPLIRIGYESSVLVYKVLARSLDFINRRLEEEG
jgi:hypothetical protein